MDMIKISALLFLLLSAIAFSVYLLSPSILSAIIEIEEQDLCGTEAVNAYQSCLSMQKSGLLIGCIPPLCPYLQQLSSIAGSIFAFISACCGVYRLYLENTRAEKK